MRGDSFRVVCVRVIWRCTRCFMSCNTDMRAGVQEETSVQLLTLYSEKRAAAELLKRVSSN